jgi:hypothetical protein
LKWLGPNYSAAERAYAQAREAGMSPFRALCAGHFASFADCWAFRAAVAEAVGCSVRTVQRASNDLKASGNLKVWPLKPTEVPPGRTRPLRCWASHRVWQWGVAAVSRTKLAQVVKQVVQPAAKRPRIGRSVAEMKAEAAALGLSLAEWLDRQSLPDTS